MGATRASNEEVADALERVADLLEAQGADRFRVRAYRRGADTVRTTTRPLAEIDEAEGLAGMEKLPGIGKSLASAIHELVATGRLSMLDRLEGEVSPEDLFASVPGIGEKLAHAVHEQLGVETLEDLELAAHDGRLENVTGFGQRRAHAVRDTLDSILSRSSRRHARRLRLVEGAAAQEPARPPVATLLGVDAEYRERASRGELHRITPRRFNPRGDAWLPVLHVARDGWEFTALYSNTARAHELGMTHDWVILYYERDGHEDQCTIVTEWHGRLEGKRVVRGREDESAAYYEGYQR